VPFGAQKAVSPPWGGVIFLRKARPKKHASDSDVSEA
jgi:hypothetical protein